MIGVNGQYIFIFSLEGENDFIKEEDDLNRFVMVEYAGNKLPAFELSFILRSPDDEKIIPKLNEGNILKVSFGRELTKKSSVSVPQPSSFNGQMASGKEGIITSEFRILNKQITRIGNDSYNIWITGVYNALKYAMNNTIFSYPNLSAMEVMKKVSSKHFDTDFNRGSSEDKQTWIQPNIPDRSFINKLVSHGYITDSFMAVGISCDGKFICKDIKLEKDEKWKFGYKLPYILINGDYVIKDNSGIMNLFHGYERDRSVFDINSSSMEGVSEDFDRLIAQSPSFNRASDVIKKISQFRLKSDNVHSKYWKAKNRFLTSSALFSSSSVELSYSNTFHLMRILDLSLFIDDRPNLGRTEAEHQSGKYFITKIVRAVDSKQFLTTITLNREAMNMYRGKLLR